MRIELLILVALAPLAPSCAEQNVTITDDHLGNIVGSSIVMSSTGGGVAWVGASMECEKETDEFHIRCQGSLHPGFYDAVVSWNDEETDAYDACESDARCQTSGSDGVSTNGTFSIANLLVGEYRVDADPSEVAVSFSATSCESRAGGEWRDMGASELEWAEDYLEAYLQTASESQSVSEDTEIEIRWEFSNDESSCQSL